MHGFGGENDMKTEYTMKTIEEMSIDMIILNEKNCKWNTRTIENLKDINMSTSDSKEHELTKNDCLTGGKLTSNLGNHLVTLHNQLSENINREMEHD